MEHTSTGHTSTGHISTGHISTGRTSLETITIGLLAIPEEFPPIPQVHSVATVPMIATSTAMSTFKD
jgi:hypothetical protein